MEAIEPSEGCVIGVHRCDLTFQNITLKKLHLLLYFSKSCIPDFSRFDSFISRSTLELMHLFEWRTETDTDFTLTCPACL
jgi:hypothetical protein